MPLTRIKSGDIGVLSENNYLSSSISNWRTYSDAAATSPVDGIGGSPTITFVQDSSAPLNYSGDFRFTNTGGVSRQGQGVSVDFEIENRHKAKILQIVLDYELVSGTLASNDLRLYIIQDPTGTPVVIEPVNTGLQNLIVDSSLKHIATFQTHVSIKNYRLCIHIGSTGTNGYIVDFANFKIGESAQSIGAVITDWQNYTPTFSSANGFATTPSSINFISRRNGSNLEIIGSLILNTTNSNTARIPLGFNGAEGNVTIDGTKLLSTTVVGRALMRQSVPMGYIYNVLATGGNNYVEFGYAQNSGAEPFTAMSGSNFQSGVSGRVQINLSVPIAGWGSNVAMSSDTGDGRVVSAIYKNLVGSLNTQYGFQWNTIVIDTHNAVSQTGSSPNARTVFTAPVNGFYQVSAFVLCSNSGYVDIYKNDSIYARISGTENTTYGDSISFTISLNAGENFYIRTMNMTSTSTSTSDGQFSVFRISAGSQVVANSEAVYLRYRCTNGQTISSSANTDIQYNDRVYDSHGAYSTSNYRFTAPMSGTYLITASILPSTNSALGFNILAFVNTASLTGADAITIASVYNSTNAMGGTVGSLTLRLNAGDYVRFTGFASTNNINLSQASPNNYSTLTITRLGI